jgi:hypothetical protein
LKGRLESAGNAGIGKRLRSCFGGIALLGSRDGARRVGAVVHGIFSRRGFCEVAGRTSRLVAGP